MVAPRVVEIELPSGRVMLAEISSIGSAAADVGTVPRFRLEDAGVAMGELARVILDSVTAHLPRTPDKVGIDLGVKLAIKSGKLTSVLAEASGEASAMLRLEWSSSPAADNSAPVSEPSGVGG